MPHSSSTTTGNLWLETPLIFSNHLSSLLNSNVYLKLENLQPSQSFKYRGISHFAVDAKNKFGENAHLIIASGGNAGLAAATAANSLGLKCTVFLPVVVSQDVHDNLKKQNANVVAVGQYYLQSLQEAEKAAQLDPNAVLVPAYDHPLIWEGHSSMIEEVSHQLNKKPDAIFCSVGGGGLLGGVLVGCKNMAWDDVPVVAVETHGSACFYHSISVNKSQWREGETEADEFWTSLDDEHQVKIAHVRNITSKAASLGATSPAAAVVKMSLDHQGGVTCAKVPDGMCMTTSCFFAEDHKSIVELACAATLSAAYHPTFFSRLFKVINKSMVPDPDKKTVVMIVCGGVKISLNEMEEYAQVVQRVKLEGLRWDVECNGETWSIPT